MEGQGAVGSAQGSVAGRMKREAGDTPEESLPRALSPLQFYCSVPVASTPPMSRNHTESPVAVRARP
jgi:hypothetical protein